MNIERLLDIAVFLLWLIILPMLALKACDTEYLNQQAKTERFLAK